jgi:hypothetical protein
MSIEVPVIGLIRIAQKAIVAGCCAPLFPIWEGLTAGRIKVKDFEGTTSQFFELARFSDKALPDSNAALRRFPKQEIFIVVTSNQFNFDLSLFDLVFDLQCAAKRIG